MAEALPFIQAGVTIFSALSSHNASQTQASGATLQAQGNVQAGIAARQAGDASLVESQFEGEQETQQASDALLAGQVGQIQAKRTGDFAVSRGLALAAASGGGAMDPTVVNTLANTTSAAAYNGAVSLYNGEEQARVLRMQAEGTEYAGYISQQQQYAKAASYDTEAGISEDKAQAFQQSGDLALLNGATSLFTKFGLGGPGSTTTTNSIASGVSNNIAVDTSFNADAGIADFAAG